MTGQTTRTLAPLIGATELDREVQALRDGIASRAAEVCRGRDHVRRWQRAGRALGMPYDVEPMTATDADACERLYSSPLWPRVAAAIRRRLRLTSALRS